jgi:hypothetical protein
MPVVDIERTLRDELGGGPFGGAMTGAVILRLARLGGGVTPGGAILGAVTAADAVAVGGGDADGATDIAADGVEPAVGGDCSPSGRRGDCVFLFFFRLRNNSSSAFTASARFRGLDAADLLAFVDDSSRGLGVVGNGGVGTAARLTTGSSSLTVTTAALSPLCALNASTVESNSSVDSESDISHTSRVYASLSLPQARAACALNL